MAVNCTLCGVSMAVAEAPGHRGNVTAPYHTDCAYMDYLYQQADKHPNPLHKVELTRSRQKLINKHQGLVTDYP